MLNVGRIIVEISVVYDQDYAAATPVSPLKSRSRSSTLDYFTKRIPACDSQANDCLSGTRLVQLISTVNMQLSLALSSLAHNAAKGTMMMNKSR